MEDEIFDEPGWDTFGLLKEAYLAIQAAIYWDLRHLACGRHDVAVLVVRLMRAPDGNMRPSELSRALSTTPSSTSRVIEEAEQMGFVDRNPDSNDGRAWQIILTEKGRKWAVSWSHAGLDAAARHLDHPLDGDVEVLEDRLRTLRDAAQKYLQVQQQATMAPAIQKQANR